jgi:hypothetical protein
MVDSSTTIVSTKAGDVGWAPLAMGHYIENTGTRRAISRCSRAATLPTCP